MPRRSPSRTSYDRPRRPSHVARERTVHSRRSACVSAVGPQRSRNSRLEPPATSTQPDVDPEGATHMITTHLHLSGDPAHDRDRWGSDPLLTMARA